MAMNWLGWMALLPLLVLLLMAQRYDIHGYRIPNILVYSGALLGLLLNGCLPAGWGFNSILPGGLGWLAALQGMALVLLLLWPVYWLGAAGAGDVKLLVMVGAFLGPRDVIGVLLATFLAGGMLALLLLWRNRRTPLPANAPKMAAPMPYAVAIAVGTLAYLLWQRMPLSGLV